MHPLSVLKYVGLSRGNTVGTRSKTRDLSNTGNKKFPPTSKVNTVD